MAVGDGRDMGEHVKEKNAIRQKILGTEEDEDEDESPDKRSLLGEDENEGEGACACAEGRAALAHAPPT